MPVDRPDEEKTSMYQGGGGVRSTRRKEQRKLCAGNFVYVWENITFVLYNVHQYSKI
jgi:hypothetical protein